MATNTNTKHPPSSCIAVVMGSRSDWSIMRHACQTLAEFAMTFEQEIVSAHRTPQRLFDYGQKAAERGISAIIAGAGGAAHLPGMLAANTTVPVLGVPIPTTHLSGLDSLYSIVQMPRGVPVATFAIGQAGAINAALFAIALHAVNNPLLADKLADYRQQQAKLALSKPLPHHNDDDLD